MDLTVKRSEVLTRSMFTMLRSGVWPLHWGLSRRWRHFLGGFSIALKTPIGAHFVVAALWCSLHYAGHFPVAAF